MRPTSGDSSVAARRVAATHRERLRRDPRRDGRLRVPTKSRSALELFDRGDRRGDYEFVGAFRREGHLVGYVCYGATPGTDRTLRSLLDRDASARSGRRRRIALLDEVERRLRAARSAIARRRDVVARRLRADAALLRRAADIVSVARIADFYAPGDDRVIYTKRSLGLQRFARRRGVVTQ